MKKLIAIVMILALLLTMAGCQKASGGRSRDDDDDRNENHPDDDGAMIFPGMEGDTDAAAPAGGAAYEIVEMDNSLLNENGDILVRRTYSKVVLLDKDPAAEAINELIEGDYEDFMDDDLYWTVEELEEGITNGLFGYDNLFHTAAASIAHNGDGILSIRITTDWFMGGVYNCNSYGLTYDLNTGKEAKLEDILGVSESEALEQLRELAGELLEEYYGEALLTDPMDILVNYTLEDYDFYVEGGELVLTFDTYEFAVGAAGAATIRTGIYIGK